MTDIDISPEAVERLANAYDCDPAGHNDTADMLRALRAALTAETARADGLAHEKPQWIAHLADAQDQVEALQSQLTAANEKLAVFESAWNAEAGEEGDTFPQRFTEAVMKNLEAFTAKENQS